MEEFETFVMDELDSEARYFERLKELDAARERASKELRLLSEQFDAQVKSLEQLSLTFEETIKGFEESPEDWDWDWGWEFREAQSKLALLHLGLMWLTRLAEVEEPGRKRLERAARLTFEVALSRVGRHHSELDPQALLNEILELAQPPRHF